MAHTQRYAVRLGERGRIVLPAALRRQLGVEAGERLVATLEDDGSVRLVSAQAVVRRLQGLFREDYPGRDLAEELLAERRREAALDEERAGV